ncbi:E3 ubiquitin- ligase RNF19B-like protein [Labeo rohita]|uniref:E3 ubiquitin-ligase RNF19B-like protein n=1 Tax=Labeo rohita TaxID=84645 RepID=A0A498NHJ4_LABRO|nr:E3 ubiquitin- ligase RNF19B-like protein [Labeo rohita]
MSKDMKKFTPFDKGIKLVSRPSDIDEYDDDPGVLRARLSCGHVIDPETLTDCCRAQLDDGQTEFRCPLCKKKWPYDEVRKLAKLTLEEQLNFEEKLGTNTAKKIVDFRDVCTFLAFVLVVAPSSKGQMTLISVWSAQFAQQKLDASLSFAGSVIECGKGLDLVLISVEMWDVEVLTRNC